jgi:putative membrane protein
VQNLHTTTGRTGVLLFVSVAERYAEIIADKGIDERVAPGTWKGIIDHLTAAIGGGRPTDGFVTAIAAIGTVLAKHFPPGSQAPNELPNHLIILQ